MYVHSVGKKVVCFSESSFNLFVVLSFVFPPYRHSVFEGQSYLELNNCELHSICIYLMMNELLYVCNTYGVLGLATLLHPLNYYCY
jgi:hypothetical protein